MSLAGALDHRRCCEEWKANRTWFSIRPLVQRSFGRCLVNLMVGLLCIRHLLRISTYSFRRNVDQRRCVFICVCSPQYISPFKQKTFCLAPNNYMPTITQIAFTAGVAGLLWMVYRRFIATSCIDHLPGPQGTSLLLGASVHPSERPLGYSS